MGFFKKLVNNISENLDEAKKDAAKRYEAAKERNVSQEGKSNSCKKVGTPTDYDAVIRAYMYSLQIIGLNDEIKNFIKDNDDDDTDTVLSQVRGMAEKRGLFAEYNLLNSSLFWTLNVKKNKQERLECRKENIFNVDEAGEKILDLDLSSKSDNPVEKAILAKEKEHSGNFMESLIKETMKEMEGVDEFIIVYGRKAQKGHFNFHYTDKNGRDFLPESLSMIGGKDIEIGGIQIEADCLADYIILHEHIIRCESYSVDDSFERPSYQVVNNNLDIVDLEEDNNEGVWEELKVTVGGDIMSLQVIRLDEELKELVRDNIDDLGDVYEQIRDTADENDLLVEFNFLQEMKQREMSVSDDNDNELECDIDNYVNVGYYPGAAEYMEDNPNPEPDDDDYEESEGYVNAVNSLEIEEGEYYESNAILKIKSRDENNFIEALIKEAINGMGGDEDDIYLLIYGQKDSEESYSFAVPNDSREEYDYDSLRLIGSGTYSIGKLEMEPDSLADFIVYDNKIYQYENGYTTYYIREPQFQLINNYLEEVSLDEEEDEIEIIGEEEPSEEKIIPDTPAKVEPIQEEVKVVQEETLSERVKDIKTVAEQNIDPFEGMFSKRLEALIKAAMQDGVLTEKEKAIILRRAEKDGEDVDEVEMLLEARFPGITVESKENKTEPVIVPQKEKVIYDEKDIYMFEEGTTVIDLSQTRKIDKEIKKIVFPKSMRIINSLVFSEFSALEVADFSKCVELVKIDNSAFNKCISLRDVDLGSCKKLKEIEFAVFKDCFNLNRVLLPHSEVKIDKFKQESVDFIVKE